MRLPFKKLAIIVASLLGTVCAQADITLISGNGTGSQDSIITALAGSTSGSFNTFGPTDFAAAQNAGNAYILAGTASGWATNLGDGSGAKWIGVDQDGYYNSSHSALYAMSFDVTQAIVNAQMNLTFSVDDQLGDANNAGIFLDGKSLAGSNSNIDWNNTIEQKNFALGGLSQGVHTLYFDVNNGGGGPSGLIFHADIGAQPTPEPSTMASIGLLLCAVVRRRRNS